MAMRNQLLALGLLLWTGCGGPDIEAPVPPQAPTWTVTVKTSTGKQFPLKVQESDTVLSLKKQIMETEGNELSTQRLIFAGRTLEDAKTLAGSGVEDGSTLYLVLKQR